MTIGTIYRITTADGRSAEGRVQGSGGVLGGPGRLAADGLRRLQTAASGAARWSGYVPAPGHVRVFPHFSAQGNGEPVDVPIVGATVTIAGEEFVQALRAAASEPPSLPLGPSRCPECHTDRAPELRAASPERLAKRCPDCGHGWFEEPPAAAGGPNVLEAFDVNIRARRRRA